MVGLYLPHLFGSTMFQDILFVVGGLVLLILGGDWLLKAAVNISIRMSIPRMVVGMTVVSFATSAPELIVSIKSALDGLPDLALGNVVGSNIANLGLVLGVTVLLSAIHVKKGFYRNDWPILMVVSILFFWFLRTEKMISTIEGIAMVALLIIFIIYSIRKGKKSNEDEDLEGETSIKTPLLIIYLIIGGVALWGGSELLIGGAKSMASSLGVTERVIGITVVSVGTSIPELAASIIAVIKKEKAISLGNLVGSNIFNILAVIGITATITPIKVIDEGLLDYDMYWMLGVAAIILPLAFVPKNAKLGLKEGIALLGIYGVFVYLTVVG